MAQDNEEDDVAISLDNLYQSKNVFYTIGAWLWSIAPFKGLQEILSLNSFSSSGDIKSIQAKFGSSVACYFQFYRFMYAGFINNLFFR